ncbi:hypothetical protein GCM10027275_13470 [Rhabdobacter roseus]|uniref:Lipopolysaccharide transport system ATP-binding protein n=1 Tax=Rhabdobacter roseus TaxID=1655419 RepID=A0A840TIH3_9BACT|nr:ABC transporter ATP-binding protein [Rhabdobacter roseus]MBB5283264.1 lipopolysaccharide transport system ATP-binding protein [Rhabdobacter roseus]
MKPIIKVQNLSKQYRLGTIGTGTLRNDFKRWMYEIRGKEDPFLKIGEANDRSIKGSSEYVWALRDINFEVMAGEVLGVIGKNGAGKSTLLKILSKVTGPTNGRIDYDGRIGSLLEVGTGFHPELTGRENIFLNGAILGMTKAEIRSKLDEIIDFSGCERYIDTPVKRYSSGMTVRLGFAVAAHLEPEILVVDEVLAVGDAEFQKKAIGKMQDVSRNDGRTVLFVSHNMSAIESLCSRVLVLKNGTTYFTGSVQDGLKKYLAADELPVNGLIIDAQTYSHPHIRINSIAVNGSAGNQLLLADNFLQVDVSGEIQVSEQIALEVRFFDKHERQVAFYSPGHYYGTTRLYEKGAFQMRETITLPEGLTSGEFYLTFDFALPNIQIWASYPKALQINTKGIISKTGREFVYETEGLIFLK